MLDGVTTFEVGGFQPGYAIEVDPEFPGDGDWGCPVVGFDRDGHVVEEFESHWGAPVVLRVVPEGGPVWVAMLPAGGLGSASGVFATPADSLVTVVAGDVAYVIDAQTPGVDAIVVSNGVHEVVPSEDPPLLLLVRFTDMRAIGPEGLAWSTPRLCIDDLKVRRTSRSGIVCTCDNLGGTPEIVLDPQSGLQTVGTRLDSFWPPDALA